MSLSSSRALANALRSTLWLISYYTNMNGSGPTLRDLKIAIGRAIAELEAQATIELTASAATASFPAKEDNQCTTTRWTTIELNLRRAGES